MRPITKLLFTGAVFITVANTSANTVFADSPLNVLRIPKQEITAKDSQESRTIKNAVDSIDKPNYLYGNLKRLHLTDSERTQFIESFKSGKAKTDVLQEAEKRAKENDKSDLAALNKAKEVTTAFIKSRDEKLFSDALKQVNLVKWNDVSELRNQVQDTKASIDKEKAERQAKEKADAEERQRVETDKANGTPYFGSDGLLVETRSPNAERAISLLLSIPGHANGAGYHASTGLDALINSLSVEEATHVIHRIEGAGFGQTGAGWAGVDSTASHQAFLDQQIHGRFGGSVHALLRAWGTFSYGGY